MIRGSVGIIDHLTKSLSVEQHLGCPMLGVRMRPLMTVDMSYIGDCDDFMCTYECTKLLYLLFVFES